MKVTDPAELRPKMEECFSMNDRVVFMDIYIDPDEHVYPMQIPTGSMKDMILSKTERTK